MIASNQWGQFVKARFKGFWRSPFSLAISAALLLWIPQLVRQGFVFERDPAFFTSIHADTAWSLGGFSMQGGNTNIGSQGIFYEPYAAVIWLVSHIGIPIDAAGWSKLIPLAMTAVAAGSAFSLARKFGAEFAGSCLASIFYVFNPWSLDYFGYFYYWTGYCLLPLLIIGALRIRNGEKCPPWLPIALLFLGGLVSWIMGAIVCILVVAVYRRLAARNFRRTIGKLGAIFLGSGAFWIVTYCFTLLFPSSATSLAYPSTGSPLQSAHPITDLLELRDFWWPHLDLDAYVGITPLALSTLAVVALVFTAIFYVALDSRHGPEIVQKSASRNILGILMVVGLLLGVGSTGVTGWAFDALRSWPLFGNNIIRSITREPARLASPFVAAVSLALALAISALIRCSADSKLHFGKVSNQLLLKIGVFLLLGAACLPSLVAFWGTYTPIKIPTSYSKLSDEIPRGVSLEIEYWPASAVIPSVGVWHFVWSNREVADPTLLASSIPSPSLSPLEQPVNELDQKESINTSGAGATKLTHLAQKLGISSLVVEQDIQLPALQRNRLNSFVASLRREGLTEKNRGNVSIFRILGKVRSPIWSNSCKVSESFFFAGFVHVACLHQSERKSSNTIISPFELPSPVTGVGLHISAPTKVDDIGTQLRVIGGDSGWIIFLPNLFATIGVLCTILFLLAFAGRFGFARMNASRRHVRPRHKARTRWGELKTKLRNSRAK